MDVDVLEEHNPKIVLALKSRKFDDLDLRNVYWTISPPSIYVATRGSH
jgi:hypothetical protein